jgi:hypothetical protein
VQCLVNSNSTNRSIREEPQRSKEPEARPIKKKRRKDDLEKVNHYPTLSPWIKKSVTHLHVWLVS